MRCSTLIHALPLALWTGLALAQAAPPAAPPPPVAPPAVPATAPPIRSAAEARARSPDQEGINRFLAELDLKQGLTSNEVARRAAANSVAAESRRAAIAMSQAQQDQAVARLWPQLTLSARYTRLSDVDQVSLGSLVATNSPPGQPIDVNDPATQLFPVEVQFPFLVNHYELRATLSVPVSDYVYRSLTAIDAADHATRSSELQERAARRRAAADGRLAYYDWVRAIGQRIVAEQSLEQAQAQYRDATRLAEAGMMARADMLQAQAQVKNVEVLLTRTRNFQTVAEQRLRTLMGDRSARRYLVGEDLLVPAPEVRLANDLEQLVSEAERSRSEFRALRESEASLKSLASLQRSDAHPRLDAVGNFVYANPNQRVFPQREEWDPSWDVGAVLSWTPTAIPAANARAREQQAQILELRAQRRQLLEALRIELVEATSSIAEAEVALASGREALAAAEESYRAKRELFQVGKGTIVDVNEAEVELTRARLAVINAAIEARSARVRLNYALGRDRLP